MGLRDVCFQRCYETTSDNFDLVNNFYIPALKEAKLYCRVAGFFSSTSFSIAAEGIAALIENSGKMRLLVSPELSKNDADVISGNSIYENYTFDLFKDVGTKEWIENDNIRALAWMLKEEKLEIKIVVDEKNRERLFHQKIGLMIDSTGDAISFSGSINETAKAWICNIEEFKVFKSWISGQDEYFSDDYNKFKKYWNYSSDNSVKVYDIPSAVKNEIIRYAPNDIQELKIIQAYKLKQKSENNCLKLFDHQKDAVKMWKENNYRLLNVMATGTGKTRTALGCIMEIIGKNKMLVVVSTPENSLTNQWKNDIDNLKLPFDRIIELKGGLNWRQKLESSILDLQLEPNNKATYIILTTHNICSKKEFCSLIEDIQKNIHIFYICDECHAIGAPMMKKALISRYDMALGLSATPDRMFDDHGTKLIYTFFGDKTYEFDIYQALHTINPITGSEYLNRFEYKPIFIELNDDELEKYRKFNSRITVCKSKLENNPDDNELLEELDKLYRNRAKIIKNCKNKIVSFEHLIVDLKENNQDRGIMAFVSDEQIGEAMSMAKRHGYNVGKITQEESTKTNKNNLISVRDKVLENFKNGELNILFGIECLDQGIDVPTASIAILLCNSTNPREYIQRVGRVIRYSPGKKKSKIYDFVVYSNQDTKVLVRELKRVNEIAKNADNYEEVIDQFKLMGVEINEHKQ